MTRLAEGADQVIAIAALAEDIAYVATLPMPKDAYLDEFQTEAAKAQLKMLLKKRGMDCGAASAPRGADSARQARARSPRNAKPSMSR